jgi:hypothetical protein
MTGFLSGSLELSRMTVATLDDMGYSVDYSQADLFPVTNVNPACLCARRRLEEPGDHTVLDETEQRPGSRNTELANDSGLEAAIAYGREKLEDMALRKIDPDEMSRQGIQFMGDQVVFVVYMDDSGNVRNIAVEN